METQQKRIKLAWKYAKYNRPDNVPDYYIPIWMNYKNFKFGSKESTWEAEKKYNEKLNELCKQYNFIRVKANIKNRGFKQYALVFIPNLLFAQILKTFAEEYGQINNETTVVPTLLRIY